MEDLSGSHPPHHVFASPEIIEIHLQNHVPIPEGTAKLVWVLDQLFRKPDEL